MTSSTNDGNRKYCEERCPTDIYNKNKKECIQMCIDQIQKTIDEYKKKYNLSIEEIGNILNNQNTLKDLLKTKFKLDDKQVNELINSELSLCEFISSKVNDHNINNKYQQKNIINLHNNRCQYATNNDVDSTMKNWVSIYSNYCKKEKKGGKPKPKSKPKSKTKKKKNYKKKTKTRRKNKRKENKRRKTYKKKK